VSSTIPTASSSTHRLLAVATTPVPFHGYAGNNPSLFAFQELLHRLQNSGIENTGVIIALSLISPVPTTTTEGDTYHIPNPHLHFPIIPNGPPIKGPIHTVARKGTSGTELIKARFIKSLVSAINTCCSIRRLVFPAASKIFAHAYIPIFCAPAVITSPMT
jgi:hypothetical protein